MPYADLFISYRRAERERVLQAAARLEDLGLNLWFDARLEAGTSFDEEINREIRTARAVLVFWSPEAIQSRWVRAEASIGLERDVLLAAFLTPTELIPPYNLVHAVDLQKWDGGQSAPEWQNLLTRLGSLIGRPHLAEEALAKAHDAEWAERDGAMRSAFESDVAEAKRRFSANHEAQPALFSQALSEMISSFESWILRRRLRDVGPAPNPLSLIADDSEGLRLDLATVERERDAAAKLASRAAGIAGGAPSIVGPDEEKPLSLWHMLALLLASPVALAASGQRRRLAIFSSVLATLGALLPFIGWFALAIANVVSLAVVLATRQRKPRRPSKTKAKGAE
jgi:hypothetical protein